MATQLQPLAPHNFRQQPPDLIDLSMREILWNRRLGTNLQMPFQYQQFARNPDGETLLFPLSEIGAGTNRKR